MSLLEHDDFPIKDKVEEVIKNDLSKLHRKGKALQALLELIDDSVLTEFYEAWNESATPPREIFEFLTELRASGEINMFEAPEALVLTYGVSQRHANNLFREWTQQFGGWPPKTRDHALRLESEGKVPSISDCGRFYRDEELYEEEGALGWWFSSKDGAQGVFYCAVQQDFLK